MILCFVFMLLRFSLLTNGIGIGIGTINKIKRRRLSNIQRKKERKQNRREKRPKKKNTKHKRFVKQ